MKIEHNNSRVTVWLTGEIDHHSARNMREQIDNTVERTKPEVLELDFSGVNFMDSSGVGLIMGRFKLLQALGGAVELRGVNHRMQKMIQLAGLDKLDLKISED